LSKKILDLELEVNKMKESQERVKTESIKKNVELKDKLEKAFEQLTANDEAAAELQKLRT
jgi:hypothetical protein